jgi:hypothetical protein
MPMADFLLDFRMVLNRYVAGGFGFPNGYTV